MYLGLIGFAIDEPDFCSLMPTNLVRAGSWI